ncbi:WASH complex subunit 2A-like isoform X12 [Hemicordylus capensis]|uniref:WASH complex subunit 2A-like isoform X12 n=1 Tax=Hemicordylus capensis TaxID=884348 RepID=UPI002303E938|nr:WASH complex subunit 2A-like isoform X12 [Hemicordylus capensis]
MEISTSAGNHHGPGGDSRLSNSTAILWAQPGSRDSTERSQLTPGLRGAPSERGLSGCRGCHRVLWLSSFQMSSASLPSEAAAPSDAEATGQLWERAWSLEEVRAGSQSWSLAADAGLLCFLQEFSQQTISRTHEIKKQLDRLIHETKSTDCRLHNVFNGFLMLSNTQFIENRVYDEEVEEHMLRTEVGDKPEQEKTREQKEADLIPKIQEAVNYGLQVLDSAFEQLDIKAGNSDSEEETNDRIELILEPKDLYIDRPLPYLIGSQPFMEQDDIGLGDLSSEEGSMDSDRGSMIDSEGKDGEELDEEFGNLSEEDQKQRIAVLSDEDEDLFGDSEKGEEEEGDMEENERLKKKTSTSFTDELAARIKGEVPCKQAKEQSYMKNKIPSKDKEEISIPSDDEDDIFKPPRLTDEDFSPFGSKGGLFSGGTGLFDDEEESDLFAELPKGEDLTEKEARVPINDEPSSKTIRKVPAGAVSLFPGRSDVFSPSSFLMEKEDKKPTEPMEDKNPSASVSLFDDGDLESNKKCSISAKYAADLFEDVEGNLFKEKPDTANTGSYAAEENKEFITGDKRQQSSAENFKPLTQTPSRDHKSLFSDEEDSEDLFSSNQSIKSKSSSFSSSKVTTKAPLSLFEDEDEEEFFGSLPKIQVSKPLQEKAASLLFSSDEEDHWKEDKSASQCSQKKEATKSVSAVSHTINKRSLFEEEEDLFAVTRDSQRKPQKPALLFEDDIVNGDSLFDLKPSHLPSSVQAITADLLGTPQETLVKKKVESLDEPDAFPTFDPEDEDVAEQQRQPRLEKDAKRKVKSVFSLFEEEEKNEDTDVSKSTQKEMAMPPEKTVCPKSTGVFQDEELLFSHKLQKDNDPDVDLFASNKKVVPKPRVKLSSGGGLFGADDEDDNDGLFSSAKAKPLVAEKKTVKKKGSTISSVEDDSKILDCDQSANQEEKSSLEAVEKSTGPAASKHKEPSSRIGKLQANLNINPAALLPTGTSNCSIVKPPPLYPETPCHEPQGVQLIKKPSATRSSEEMEVSFDDPMQAEILQNVNKGRIKMTGKRPPTRTARRLAAQESNENKKIIAEDSSLSLSKESSVPPATLYDGRCREQNTDKANLPPLINSSNQLCETDGSPVSKSTALFDVDDLFESSNSSTNSTVSKEVLQSKAKAKMETLATQVPRPSMPLALGDPNCEVIFHPVKPSKKPSPVSFLEDQEDLFTNKKTVKRKDPKTPTQSNQDPPMKDIFEDDIFASEAVKLPVKTKELEVNLFDDDVDIFADLAVKPKERSAKKKMEAKSIFDEDTDDIFSPSSQSKTSTKKALSFQTVSETKTEFRASSSFEDPLNAFEDQ